MRLIDADAEITRIQQEMQRIDAKIERLKKLAAEEKFNTLHNFEKELEKCYRNKADCKAEIATLKNYQTAYDVDKVIDEVRDDCYSMGFDENQTEIIVDDIRAERAVKKPDQQQA